MQLCGFHATNATAPTGKSTAHGMTRSGIRACNAEHAVVAPQVELPESPLHESRQLEPTSTSSCHQSPASRPVSLPSWPALSSTLTTHPIVTRGVLHTLICLLVAAVALMFTDRAVAAQSIKLATTTSTENSGLLDILLPAFRETADIQVLSIAVGTGRALRLGVNGDVDVVMVHAKEAELEFLKAGYGTRREEFMYNDFIIVGPESDPAGLGEVAGVTDALAAIARDRAVFVSRGDDSGTHKREQSLWSDTGVVPEGSWYREAGQGMGKVLQIASELGAYTLTDRGTWLKVGERLNLSVVFEADPKLFNYYSVIPVNPEKHPRIRHEAAVQFADWLTSEEAQVLIRDYTINGQSAFIPTRLP